MARAANQPSAVQMVKQFEKDVLRFFAFSAAIAVKMVKTKQVEQNLSRRKSLSFPRVPRLPRLPCFADSCGSTPLSLCTAIAEIVRKPRAFCGHWKSRSVWSASSLLALFDEAQAGKREQAPRIPNASRGSVAALPLCGHRVSAVYLHCGFRCGSVALGSLVVHF